ncbi:MAG: protein phosphatase 2C domain-containing protein [Ruminococcus flavefaciens]|nr:protein phosphatase 2C domain-containing protein [Ruminococcus flavefaciens]
MKLDVFEYSNKGGRSYNEDSVGGSTDGSNGIFVIADGLGGHSLGELASSCAVNVITAGWQGFGNKPQEQLKELFEQANKAILELQKKNRTIMKSTAVVLAIEENKAVWANSGDSRVYYFHRNKLDSYTEDHSVAYKKYKAGEITRDMLGSDEDQSSLLRTLGNEDRFVPDTHESLNALEVGDAFMLCSDGAWEYLRDEEILIDLLKSKNAEHWTELMLLRLMERIDNTNDNISIIAIKIIK